MNRLRIKGILLGLILTFLIPCSLYAAENQTASNKVFTESEDEVKKGLVKEGKHYFYYKDGKKKTNYWKTIDGYKYYFTLKGYAATDCINIDGKAYVFDKDAHLIMPSKRKILKSQGHYFYVNTNGQAQTGWFRIGEKLYRADPKGRLYQNRTYEGITFADNCAAEKGTACSLKIKAMKITESITNSKMTKQQKLYACWKYLVNSGKFRYRSYTPNIYKAGWQKECALDMFTRFSGSCSGFACAFAALACEVGYDPYIVYGRVPGSRDQASDGMTRHCWVKIGNGYYDPEGAYAGWAGFIYGKSYYPIYHTVTKVINFRKSN